MSRARTRLMHQTWGQRLAVFAFALALVAGLIGVTFAAGYIIGRLIL